MKDWDTCLLIPPGEVMVTLTRTVSKDWGVRSWTARWGVGVEEVETVSINDYF